VVAFLGSRLTKFTEANGARLSEAVVREWVKEAVEQARERFRELANNSPGGIAVFHATLVGAVVGPSGGVFFHVGDGAGLATCFKDLSASVVSQPENGEYANDTYFVTQDQWEQHLRTTPFGADFDLIALMSDGVMPFALARGAKSPSAPFFEPLSRYLADHERNESERELAALLQRDAIRRITGDDKTLVWALRGGG
jgi:hypothetical protein